ncbi:unnamed product [Ostreococcus tauri]|uniref:Unnamed product n=1 Tax=Ostreococcus tauri TaxID=70448 RepID=Q01AI0_OSTTA|nr:unnamed product [Ostreococcus tauri]OUS49589.1 hypothetical protein BE221DRAFT_66249 [Ostreococcus tauri]CAL51818.1 unnamed product [Ostreococcus tauri]|eukprot:XP_003078938.1 unnamed product [Ostreococcus tauri]
MGAAEGPSQWEHQVGHAMDLLLGLMALVGGFLGWMYCHLRAERRRRMAERARLVSERGVV